MPASTPKYSLWYPTTTNAVKIASHDLMTMQVSVETALSIFDKKSTQAAADAATATTNAQTAMEAASSSASDAASSAADAESSATSATNAETAAVAAASGMKSATVDQTTSHLMVTFANDTVVDAGLIPGASDGSVAAFLENTASNSHAAVVSTVDAHLGGDSTGLVTDVAAITPDNAKRAVGKGELIYNVKDFGAVGDGATDDTAAINAALAAGTRILFPPGSTYRTTGTINPPAGAHIDAKGATLAYEGTGAGVRIASSDVTIDGLTVDMRADLNLDGGSDYNQQGIYVSAAGGADNVTLRGVTVKNCWRYGIAITEASGTSPINNVTIDNCTVLSPPRRGISVQQNNGTGLTIRDCTVTSPGLQGIVVAAGKNSHVTDCTVTDAGDMGIVIGGVPTLALTSVTVKGCTVETAAKYGFALSQSVTEWAIQGCTAKTCVQGGFTIDTELTGSTGVIQSAPGALSGCVSTGATGGRGIQVRMSSDVTVSGCTVKDNSAEGIFLSSSSGCALTGNVVTGNGTYGIRFAEAAGTASGGHSLSGNAVSGNTTSNWSPYALTNPSNFATTSTTVPTS